MYVSVGQHVNVSHACSCGLTNVCEFKCVCQYVFASSVCVVTL